MTLRYVKRLTTQQTRNSVAPARESHVSIAQCTYVSISVWGYGRYKSFGVERHVDCLIVTRVLEDLVAFVLRVFLFLEDGAETSPSQTSVAHVLTILKMEAASSTEVSGFTSLQGVTSNKSEYSLFLL